MRLKLIGVIIAAIVGGGSISIDLTSKEKSLGYSHVVGDRVYKDNGVYSYRADFLKHCGDCSSFYHEPIVIVEQGKVEILPLADFKQLPDIHNTYPKRVGNRLYNEDGSYSEDNICRGCQRK